MQNQSESPNPPTRRLHKLFAAFGCAVAVSLAITLMLVTWFTTNIFENTVFHWAARDQMLQITRESAQLAPFPCDESAVKVRAEGTILSRGFRANFTASPSSLHMWLQESTGTREALPIRKDPLTTHYDVIPVGAADSATVDVDELTSSVKIHVGN